MRIKKYTVYRFDELPEDIQEIAIQNMSDLHVQFEWWENLYDDAERIGLKLTSFDLDRRREAKGDFLLDAKEVAKNIIREHGEETGTYSTAKDYLEDRKKLMREACQADADELCISFSFKEGVFDIVPFTEDELDEIGLDELDDEFQYSLLEDYSILLQKEHDHLTSEEVIRESLKSGAFEFTEDGKFDGFGG